MLLEYGTSNFLSFRGEAYLDLHPAKNRAINRYPNNYSTLDTGEKGLKVSVIVGENAGGKSNFVRSLFFLQNLMSRSDAEARSYPSLVHSANVVRSDDGTIDVSLSNSCQEFSLSLVADGQSFQYDLELDHLGVVIESLGVKLRKHEEPLLIFRNTRVGETLLKSADDDGERSIETEYDFAFSDYNGTIPRELLESGLPDHINAKQLSVVWLAMVGEKCCRSFVDAVTKNIVFARYGDRDFFGGEPMVESLSSLMRKESYCEIVRLIDPSILRIEVDEDNPFFDSVVVRANGEGRLFSRPVREDSAGVRQFLYWAYYIYLVVYEDKTVFADEIDSAINPVLSDRVLAFINGKRHHGQFIFTTHNIFNLTLRTNMKEQINFVTKDPITLSSTMYSLADFSDIRYDVKEELYEFYLKGALGGTVHA